MARSHIADLVGRVLGGRYRLTRRLGQGAFAQVYVADDVTLRRRVAIKVLNPALADERAFLRRFTAEAQAVASLRHPHILRVYDWGEDDGDPYLVMELLEGGSLRSFLDQGRRLSPSQAVRVGADVAGALDHAQRRGLIHRDIKPANLIFDDEGRIALADFGLARALAEATLTEPTGTVIGTARYAAPEQIHGESLDHRADVYALALVLVEATTGQVPFAADTSLATLMRRLREPIKVGADIGPLGPVLEAAGTVAASDRLDAAELAARLEELAGRMAPPARLVLAGPLIGGDVEVDDQPTDIPGRPGLFDIEAVESRRPRPPARGPVAPAPPSRPPSPSTPPAPPRSSWTPIAVPPPPPPPGGTREREAAEAPQAWGGVEAGGVSRGWARREAGDDATVSFDALNDLDGGDFDRDDLEDRGLDEVVRPGVEDEGPPLAPRRGRRAVGILVVLTALVVLAGGGGAAYVLTRPASTYAVPPLRGDTVSAATTALQRNHLRLAVRNHAYDPSAAVGTILTQVPTGGRLTDGKAVGVVVSKGPHPIRVPTVTGHTQADATSVITTAGLRVGQVDRATSMTVPSGSVISATPAGGTLLPHQSIALVISTGKPTVVVPTLHGPDVASYDAAAAALKTLGLPTTKTSEYNNAVPAGEVIITDPAPGVTVTVGTTINVAISLGPHLVVVPNVSGDTVTAAAQALNAEGFSVSSVNGSPLGTVTSTSPGGGGSVLYGSSVILTTG